MSTSRAANVHRTIWLAVLLCVGGCTSPNVKPQLSVDAQAEALSNFSMGLLAKNAGDIDQAIFHVEKAIEINPKAETPYPVAISLLLLKDQKADALGLAQQLFEKRPDSSVAHLLLAEVYSLIGSTNQADRIFREAAASFPQSTEALTGLARHLISTGRPTEAIEPFTRALNVDADDQETLQWLGALYIGLAETNDSTADESIETGIDYLKQAAEIEPQLPKLWEQLGYAYLSIDEYTEAQKAFEKELNLYPDNLPVSRQLIDIYIQTKSFERAIEYSEKIAENTGTDLGLWLQYLQKNLPSDQQSLLINYLEKGIQISPSPSIFYYNQLGSLYIDRGEFDKAQKTFDAALKNYPENPVIQVVRGYSLFRQEKYKEAYDAFRRVQKQSEEAHEPLTPFSYFHLIVSAQKTDRLDVSAKRMAEACRNDPEFMASYMETALKKDSPISSDELMELLTQLRESAPEIDETIYYLMLLHTEEEEFEESLNLARELETRLSNQDMATHPLTGLFYYQYAAMTEQAGNLEDAERLFFKAIQSGSPAIQASAQNYIAYMWAERGKKLDLALDLIQQALEIDPTNAAFLDTLGWIYYQQGRYSEALPVLKRALQLNQEWDPVIWEHLGDTFLKLGNEELATQAWENAQEKSPGNTNLTSRILNKKLNSETPREPEDTLEDKPPHPSPSSPPAAPATDATTPSP